MLYDFDIFLLPDGFQQGPLDLLTRYIFVMQDAEFGMAAFFSKLEIAFRILVEPGPPVDDLLDPVGPFRHYDLHGSRITKPVARNQRILDMLVKAVMLKVRRPGDPALRIFGIGLVRAGFRYDQDLLLRVMLSHFERIA